MSTYYQTMKKVFAADLFDGRFDAFGVKEHFTEETTEHARLLTDGHENYLWVYVDDDGFVERLTRYLPNGAPGKILAAIAEACDTQIVSEYEPQFWGFNTQEEWDAYQLGVAREHEREFRVEILKFVRGQPNDIRSGTIGMQQAEIAAKLVADDPTLLLAANHEELWAAIKTTYGRDHLVVVKLTPVELAAAKMHVTHSDDLPQA